MAGANDLNVKRVQEALPYCIIPQNSVVKNLQGSVSSLYVRPTGSDITGDGSIGAPFQTLGKALYQLSISYIDGQVIIDITGCDINERLDFTPFISSIFSGTSNGSEIYSPYGNTIEPRIFIVSSLVPDVNPATLPAIQSAGVPDHTRLGTLVTNAAWTPAEHQWKFAISGPTDNISSVDLATMPPILVANSDATTIWGISHPLSSGSYISFWKPGATITISDTNYFKLTNVQGCIGFYGIEFLSSNNPVARSFDVKGTQKLTFDCCRFNQTCSMLGGGFGNVFFYMCMFPNGGEVFENQGSNLYMERCISGRALFSTSHIDLRTLSAIPYTYLEEIFTSRLGNYDIIGGILEIEKCYCDGDTLTLANGCIFQTNGLYHDGSIVSGEFCAIKFEDSYVGGFTIGAMSTAIFRNISTTPPWGTFAVTVMDQDGVTSTQHNGGDMTNPFDFSIAAQGTFVHGTTV